MKQKTACLARDSLEVSERNYSMTEEWKPVVGYEEFYEASTLGQIRNIKTGYILKQHPCTKAPYMQVRMAYMSNPAKSKLVHRLVWMAFNGEIDSSIELNHIDGDKSNNRLDNLELSTRQDNLRHACENGLQFQKLTPDDVRNIRLLLEDGVTQQKIADMYGVNNSMISQIKTGKRWSWIK